MISGMKVKVKTILVSLTTLYLYVLLMPPNTSNHK
jgi:hypothetical protein